VLHIQQGVSQEELYRIAVRRESTSDCILQGIPCPNIDSGSIPSLHRGLPARHGSRFELSIASCSGPGPSLSLSFGYRTRLPKYCIQGHGLRRQLHRGTRQALGGCHR